ncbi:MAG TPA: purine-nucleoside phosphorylase, partial [Candidatus Dormibacteraeota bacterium]|nr:purine-nucleoside phosphorylase [Candidatus Dormibacteraeota bacterium]
AGEVLAGQWRGKRVVVFAGRVHLYQGFSAQQVTVGIRLAAEAGASTIVLTNAAGAINESYAPGDLMLISDQLNLTGQNPLVAIPQQDQFLDCGELYSERLRAHMRAAAKENTLHEGVYAGVFGPSFETPAESRWLRAIGADAVGMSTVLEAIVAKHRGLSTLGISVITNRAGAGSTAHSAVNATAEASGERLASLLDAFMMEI